jgi:hypothetical protein
MFKIVLTNSTEDAEISFKVKGTPIAKKWFAELCKNYPIYEDNRFSSWNMDHNLIDDLNQQIEIINMYDNIIDRKASVTTTQHDLNYLHKFFEDLRGEATIGTLWFHRAPTEVKTALEKSLVVTFTDSTRILLADEDIKEFTYCWKKGTVYINYCHVGKPVLDVFKDKDSITKGATPQTHYSADFMIKFGPSTNYLVFILRKLIINIWLKFQKFKFKNPNIGYIPVADMIGEFNIEDYRKFNKVKSVICLK